MATYKKCDACNLPLSDERVLVLAEDNQGAAMNLEGERREVIDLCRGCWAMWRAFLQGRLDESIRQETAGVA